MSEELYLKNRENEFSKDDFDSIQEAITTLSSASQDQFEEIKKEKWFTRLFDMVTFSQKGKERLAAQIGSVAQAQQILLEILLRLSSNDEKISDMVVNSMADIKKMQGQDLYLLSKINQLENITLGIKADMDIKALPKSAGKVLTACFYHINQELDDDTISESQQRYANAVLEYLGEEHQNVGDLGSALSRFDESVRKMMLTCCMEYLFLGDRSFALCERFQSFIDDFNIGNKTVKTIEKRTLALYRLRGEDGFISKYRAASFEKIEETFQVDFLERSDLTDQGAETPGGCETADEVDTSIPREPLSLSGIISIEKKRVYENKVIHFSSTIIECTAEVEFRNCTIHYNEDEGSRFNLKKGASLTILGSTVVCHGRGRNDTFFITAQSADTCKIKNSCFVDCVDFLSGNFSTFLFSENECCDCCLNFLNITVKQCGNMTMESCDFMFAVEPAFVAHDVELDALCGECIFISTPYYSCDANALITNCRVGCASGEDGTHCTYMDSVDFIRLRGDCSAKVGYCTFTDIKKCITGQAFIYNCIFKRCQDVIYGGTCEILNDQFIDCSHVAQALSEGSQIKNCQFCGGTQRDYIEGEAIKIEACEFVNLYSKPTDGFSFEGCGIISLKAYWSSGSEAKKLVPSHISKCIFSGIRLESWQPFPDLFIPSFLVSLDVSEDPHKSLVVVSDCIFRNCATDDRSGEIIRQKNKHYGLFNRETTFRAVSIQNCIGYDQTTDLAHFAMTTDFELKQTDGEGHRFGCGREDKLPSREDCLKVKDELIHEKEPLIPQC